VRGYILRLGAWEAAGCEGQATPETENPSTCDPTKRGKPGHDAAGAAWRRAQRLGSPALGIIGKAAGHYIIYCPDHLVPYVHRGRLRIGSACTDSAWLPRCCIWATLFPGEPPAKLGSAIDLHAKPRMHSRFWSATPGATREIRVRRGDL
jgi:hypothetical protein